MSVTSKKLFLNENIDTELIVEAQIPDYVKNIDLALIGADKILANGNVINKIGSKVLCLSCKFYNKPVYVLPDISKFSDELEFSQINHPKNEIWQNSPELVSISNYYFEEIDKELITEIISEN